MADIAILECSHADEHAVEGHLSPSISARIAEKAGAKKMVLTHFYPDALESDIHEQFIRQRVARYEASIAGDAAMHQALDDFEVPEP